MKNTLLISLILAITILFTACGTRVPFVQKEIAQKNAMVYIYVSDEIGNDDEISDPSYMIRINGKTTDERIKIKEYVVYELKANETKIAIVRGAVEEQSLKLDLKAANEYYLRVDGNLDGGGFSFTKMSKVDALPEISKTGLAGSTVVNESLIVTEIVNPESEDKQNGTKSENLSKVDEIKEAYKLKDNGLITQEEYEKLKAEIIAK